MTTKKKTKERPNSNILKSIQNTAKDIYDKASKKQKPQIRLPVRSLSNVKYRSSTGFLELGKQSKTRTMTYNTVKGFAQTLKMMAVSKGLIESDDHASKREMYYISKNWGPAKFDDQPDSDTVMDDIEAMMHVNREQLRFIPEEKGGEVAGKLMVFDRDRSSGKPLKIDCTGFGSGAYSIPISVEHLGFETKAKFILCIETSAMFHRLVAHSFWKKANCILISMGGVPTRACRRFVRRLSDSMKLPVYTFVDGDPYGFANIYRTLKVGSGNAAHINAFFCVPKARFLGVTPQDIKDFELPTHDLKEADIKRAKDAMKNDPFFRAHKAWEKALEQMIKMGVRAEQQALAKHGLNYVIDEYLPQKLKKTAQFLP